MRDKHVKVGVGVIIQNEDARILLIQRLNNGGIWSIPGGHLDQGETFEEAAIRECKEELNITVKNPKVVGVRNNIDWYKKSGTHAVSIILLVNEWEGEPKSQEAEKIGEVVWTDPNNLPEPHFDGSKEGVKQFLNDKFYEPNR
ncbi:NUDIX domain-containing protein [Candidatus Dojkabacteria bacterium]|nr:NUDIX domain-containing protein [Candidatus Dojkabacteria bacterium]